MSTLWAKNLQRIASRRHVVGKLEEVSFNICLLGVNRKMMGSRVCVNRLYHRRDDARWNKYNLAICALTHIFYRS